MRMSPPLVLLTACANGAEPGASDPAADSPVDATVQMAAPTQGYQLTTPAYRVPAHTEVDICTIVKLAPHEAEKLVWVNRMESLVSPGTHHMNVLIGQFSFLDGFLGEGASEDALGAEIGQQPCSELSTMEVAFPVFPSQRENQEITFPAGVAAPMPLPLVLVFSHHYVNTTDQAIDINAVLNMETIAGEDVVDVAGLVFDDIGDLEVAPGTQAIVERTCVVERDVSVALVSTHTHEWAECTTLNEYDAETQTVAEAPFFVNKRWDQPPILHFEPGAYALSAGDGIHWACHYTNTTERMLTNDGTADGEMCVFAAVTYPSPWSVEDVEATVDSGDIGALASLLGDALGPCDTTIDTAPSPWDGTDVCGPLVQTESNVLD